MKLRKNDLIIVITGKEKGKKGKVLKTFEQSILVEGINKVKRAVKPGVVSKEGGIIEFEKPINVSNVMFFDEKIDKPIKLGYKVVDGKKLRVNKKTGDLITNAK